MNLKKNMVALYWSVRFGMKVAKESKNATEFFSSLLDLYAGYVYIEIELIEFLVLLSIDRSFGLFVIAFILKRTHIDGTHCIYINVFVYILFKVNGYFS